MYPDVTGRRIKKKAVPTDTELLSSFMQDDLFVFTVVNGIDDAGDAGK